MMPSWLPSLLVASMGRGAARRFEAATRDPVGTQQRKLLEIITRNRDTEYGREHGFARVGSLADWRAAAPVVSYDDIEKRVERMTRGERNVLTAEEPLMFARTSGTSGHPKLIPVTRSCYARDHADQMRTFVHHARMDHPALFDGKVLSLVSPAVEGHTPCGLPYGSTSGQIYRNLPRVIRNTYAIPYEVFEISDYEAEYYVLMRIGLVEDVTFLCTANPTSILKLCETADQESDALLRDIADGTLRRDLDLEPAIRGIVQARCHRNPTRARTLEKARGRRGGRLLPADYWPRLALIGCWKGGTVGFYLDRFPEWFDPDGKRPIPVRDWGYLSSEARGSIPLNDDGGGVLTVRTHVFEFVDAAQLDAHPEESAAWRFLGVEELEENGEYYVFFTTTGGLYRYDINDVVKVVGRHNATPEIAFLRKGRDVTSLTGEKVSANQVIRAFQQAARETRAELAHFEAKADVAEARYVFKIEPARPIPAEGRKALLASVERHLAALNLEYAGKRKSLRLNPPVLQVMRRGWHDAEKRHLATKGRRLFQFKAVVLSSIAPDDNREDPHLETVVTLD